MPLFPIMSSIWYPFGLVRLVLLGVDLTRVPEHVGGERSLRVLAQEARRDPSVGEVFAVLQHVSGLVVGAGVPPRDGFERQVAHVVEALVHLFQRDAERVRQAGHEPGALVDR